MDWNDLKLFLAVARHGSVRGAACELGVNQSTVNRRMEVLEHDLNLTLFSRTTRGLSLTTHGRAVATAAMPMGQMAENVQAESERLRRVLKGTLKITAPVVFGVVFVMPILEAFRRRHPEVLIEYDASERQFDLAAGEADIALRAGPSPPDEGLAADLLHHPAWAVYCSEAFAESRGMPASLAELRGFPVVTLGGPVGAGAQNGWFMSHVDSAKVAGVASGVPNMAQVLHAGLGVGILPIIVASQERGLRFCFGPVPELRTNLWLVSTVKARREANVAAFVKVALRWFRDGNAIAIERAGVPAPGALTP